MAPDQVAESADLLLGVELGAQVEEVELDAAGVLLGVAGGQQVPVALGGGAAEGEIHDPPRGLPGDVRLRAGGSPLGALPISPSRGGRK